MDPNNEDVLGKKTQITTYNQGFLKFIQEIFTKHPQGLYSVWLPKLQNKKDTVM